MREKSRKSSIKQRLAEWREKAPLHAIFDNMPVMIGQFDRSGQLVRANAEWERTFGGGEAETRQDILEKLYPDPELRERMKDFLAGLPRRWHDFPTRAHDGKTINVTWSRFALPDGSSVIFGIDITERERTAEERLIVHAAVEAALARLRAIESVTHALESMALDDLLRELMTRLREALKTDGVGVELFDEHNNDLTLTAVGGGPLGHLVGARVPLQTPLWNRLLKDRRPVILDDAQAEAGPELREWAKREAGGFRSCMGAPLIAGDKVIGLVVAVSIAERQFTNDELELLRMVAERVTPTIERSRLLDSARATLKRLEALSRRLLSIQEEERQRLAMELHDELGQILTAVKINLQSMPAQVQEAVANIDRAMQTTRDLALELRPPMLDDLGLASALRWYSDRFANKAHLTTHLSVDEVPDAPPDVATGCFRVAQEALTNVVRHAAARNVTGAAALDFVRRERPSAVILDLGLPDIDGRNLFTKIAQLHPRLPVVFSTGHFDRSQLEHFMSQPHVGYVMKPYEYGALLSELARAIKGEDARE